MKSSKKRSLKRTMRQMNTKKIARRALHVVDDVCDKKNEAKKKPWGSTVERFELPRAMPNRYQVTQVSCILVYRLNRSAILSSKRNRFSPRFT